MSNIDPRVVKRLRSGDALEPSDALKALVAAGAAKDPEVVAAVEGRLRDGSFFTDDALILWIIAAAPVSISVFNSQWSRLKASPAAVVELLKSKAVSARDVEQAALDLLDRYGTEPGQSYRPELFDALKDAGSKACLPWLRSLQVDLVSESALRRDLAKVLPDFETHIVASVLAESSQKCADAIAAIEARTDATVGDEAGTTVEPPSSVRPSRFAAKHLDEALRVSTGSSPGTCLNQLRMFAEAMCDELFVRWGMGAAAPDTLGAKLTALKDPLKNKNRWFQARLWALKFLVDFGSHHTPELEGLTAEDVRIAVELAEGLHRSYLSLDR